MFDTSAPPFIFISASPESINHTQLKFVDMWQGFAKPMDKNRFIDSIRVLSKKNILNSEAFEPAKVLFSRRRTHQCRSRENHAQSDMAILLLLLTPAQRPYT
ncbi:hypothetical protein P4S73_13590 [Paraglaciecola sp. Hal342]